MSILNCNIGKRTIIHNPHLVDLCYCTIGDDCEIGSFTKIEKDVIIGMNVSISDFVKIPERAVIDDNVVIGSYVRLGKGCWIQEGTIIKCKATISPDVSIGSNCFIGPHALLLHGDLDGKHLPCFISDKVYIGSGVIVAPGVDIVSGVVIGASSFVNKNIIEPGVYVGVPCKKIKDLPKSE